MADAALLQLVQDLEWLGCELEYCGHKHAMEAFPEVGPTWDTFREKQRGVLTTADKLERELKNAVRFNPTRLVGVDYPLAETLDSITDLLAAVEDIKASAVFAVQELPPKVRAFARMIENYLTAVGVMNR
jgi:hypothetical protein